MLKHGRRIRAPALAALVYACVPAMTTSPANDEAAIRARTAEFMAAAQRGDVEMLAAMHTPTAALAMPNAALASGATQVRTAWSEFVRLPNLSISWQPTTVRVAASGDLATEFGTYEMAFDSPGGPVSDRGYYTTVWQKVDGRWLVASDMATSSVPLPAPPDPGSAMATHPAAGLTWNNLELPGFAPGLRIATIQGDPGVAGGTYTLRLMFPDGYEFPVHWHPNAENLTVMSGTFRLAMGNSMDRAALRSYSPGDYLFIPGGMAHWGNVTGQTVIQLHGIGPFAVNLGAGPR